MGDPLARHQLERRRGIEASACTTIVPPTSTVQSIATQLMFENKPSEHSVTQSLR